MQHYVAGFLFNPSRDRVVLVKKLRPAWQKGHLNGVGGKVEPGEPAAAAMAREFREETGVAIAPSGWTHFVTLSGADFRVDFFFASSPSAGEVATMTDEPIGLYPTDPLPAHVIPNLRWLIPLSQDRTLRFPVELPDAGA